MFYDFLLSYSNWKSQIVIVLIFAWKNTQITHSPGFFFFEQIITGNWLEKFLEA